MAGGRREISHSHAEPHRSGAHGQVESGGLRDEKGGVGQEESKPWGGGPSALGRILQDQLQADEAYLVGCGVFVDTAVKDSIIIKGAAKRFLRMS